MSSPESTFLSILVCFFLVFSLNYVFSGLFFWDFVFFKAFKNINCFLSQETRSCDAENTARRKKRRSLYRRYLCTYTFLFFLSFFTLMLVVLSVSWILFGLKKKRCCFLQILREKRKKNKDLKKKMIFFISVYSLGVFTMAFLVQMSGKSFIFAFQAFSVLGIS